MLDPLILCNRIATGGNCLEAPHAFVQPDPCRVQVRRSLGEVRVPEHVLDVVQRPSCFEQPASTLVAEIVEVEIDRVEHRA